MSDDKISESRETYRLLLDLQMQEYVQSDRELPDSLRQKAYLLLQLYTVFIGGLIALLDLVLPLENDLGSAQLAVIVIAGIFLTLAILSLLDAIHVKVRDVFDSAGLKALLMKREVDFILLAQLLYDKLEELKIENHRRNTALAQSIHKSYVYFYLSVVLGILTYIWCLI